MSKAIFPPQMLPFQPAFQCPARWPSTYQFTVLLLPGFKNRQLLCRHLRYMHPSSQPSLYWSTSGTRIRGLSGPDKHSWFTPLKGVRRPVSSQHLHDGRQHHADACHLLHPQHDCGPPCAGVAAVGSEVFCMYDRIVWKKNSNFIV